MPDFLSDIVVADMTKMNIVIKHIKSDIVIGDKEHGGKVTHETYNNFVKKCYGDCYDCGNTRILYKYTDDEGDKIYTSCLFCYIGDDWGNDMFVVVTK